MSYKVVSQVRMVNAIGAERVANENKILVGAHIMGTNAPQAGTTKTMSLRQHLERYFEFAQLNANWRTEILAGCTTFMTMA